MSYQVFSPQELRNVLAGHSAAGGPRLARPLSFPKCDRIRDELERLVLELGCLMREAKPDLMLGDNQKTLLIAKIAFWLIGTQSASVTGIRERRAFLDQLAEATINVPDWMFHAGVATALVWGRSHPAEPRREEDVKPIVRWQGATSVVLELRTAEHLVEQGFLARNCLGTSLDGPLFAHVDGQLAPRAAGRLRYLRMIESGDYRIFALRDLSGQSLATIEYHARRGYVSNLEITRGSEVLRRDALLDIFTAFRAMCLPLEIAAHRISPLIVRSIRFSSASADIGVATRSQGTVCVAPDISPGLLSRLLGYSALMVDLTALPDERHREIPPVVAAHLYSGSATWPKRLKVVLGAAHFPVVINANVERLNFCGSDLRLPLLDDGYFRNLRAVRGHAILSQLRRAAFPRLEWVGGSADFGAVPTYAYPAMTDRGGALLPARLQRELEHSVGVLDHPAQAQPKEQGCELAIAS